MSRAAPMALALCAASLLGAGAARANLQAFPPGTPVIPMDAC